jgi:hypothetical protein
MQISESLPNGIKKKIRDVVYGTHEIDLRPHESYALLSINMAE